MKDKACQQMSFKPHLHALKNAARHAKFSAPCLIYLWGDYLREVVSAPLKFWALEPHFMWDWYVNMSKIVRAVPWNCQHGAKNLACHGDFLSMCKWGFTDWFWKVPSRGGEWSIKIFTSSQNFTFARLARKI